MPGWRGNPDFRGFVDASLAKQVRRTSFRVLRGVVSRTPVDEGRLKGNWQLGVGSAPADILDRVADGSVDAEIIAEEISKIPESKIDSSIFIVNNLPYAVPIENGHGGRNPGVMVEATVRRLKLR